MESRTETKFRNVKFALSRGYRGIAEYTQYTPPVYTAYFVYIWFTVYTRLLYTIINIHMTNMSILKTVYSRNLAFINFLLLVYIYCVYSV
jgi:hypothetical protein